MHEPDASWRELIACAFEENGDSWEYVVACTLSDDELDKRFYSGYGSPEGASFTLWTLDFVYFPACYDGGEWCDSVRRNPCKVGKERVGGY